MMCDSKSDVGAINFPNHIFEEWVAFVVELDQSQLVGEHGQCRKGERIMHARYRQNS